VVGVVCLLGAFLPATARAAELCGITFLVVGVSGVEVRYEVESFASRDGKELGKLFRGLSVSDVPCGEFSYVLAMSETSTGLGKLRGRVRLTDARQWLMLGTDRTLAIWKTGAMAIDRADPSGYTFRGKIVGLPSSRPPTWVRFLEVFGQDVRETEVSGAGEFEFRRSFSGTYCVMILQPGHIVSINWLEIRPPAGSQSVVLDLSKPEPSVVP